MGLPGWTSQLREVCYGPLSFVEVHAKGKSVSFFAYKSFNFLISATRVESLLSSFRCALALIAMKKRYILSR